jgi:hypothetical protein
MMRLDTIAKDLMLARISVIKIDVEGYERDVLAGAVKILSRDRPIVFFEFADWAEDRGGEGCCPGDAQKFLWSIGYKIYTLDSWIRNGPPLETPLAKGSVDLVAAYPD